MLFYSGGPDTPLLTGINQKTSDYLREPGETFLAVNVHGDRIGSLTKRPGYTIIGATIGASQDILGLQAYYQAGAARRLIAIVDGATNAGVQFSTGGAWSSINTTLTAGAVHESEQFLNRLFFVGYNATTANFITNFTISGTGYLTADGTNLSGMAQGRVIRRFNDLLFVGNARIGGTNYPSRVYYSSTPSAAGAITWTSTNYFSVPEDNNENITGLEVNANRLLIFKERSLYRWDESSVQYVADIGTPTGRTIKTIGYFTFFYSQNGAGIYIYAGGKPKLISQKIQPVIDAITQTTLTTLRSEGDFDHYYLSVGTITLDLPYGDTLTVSNAVIVYTISTNSWYLYSLADPVRYMTRFVDDTNGFDRVYFGNNNGEIFRLATDTDDVFSDDGGAIAAQIRYRTPIGVPHESKTVNKAWVLMDRAQGANFRCRADNRDWKRNHQVNSNVEPIPLDLEGKTFEMEVSESSTLAPFVMNGFSYDVTLRGQTK